MTRKGVNKAFSREKRSIPQNDDYISRGGWDNNAQKSPSKYQKKRWIVYNMTAIRFGREQRQSGTNDDDVALDQTKF